MHTSLCADVRSEHASALFMRRIDTAAYFDSSKNAAGINSASEFYVCRRVDLKTGDFRLTSE